VAVTGALGANAGDNGDQGVAYVFYRDQGGPSAWGQVAKLTADDGVASDYFGWPVWLSGATVIAGASGAAHIFTLDIPGPPLHRVFLPFAIKQASNQPRFPYAGICSRLRTRGVTCYGRTAAFQ